MNKMRFEYGQKYKDRKNSLNVLYIFVGYSASNKPVFQYVHNNGQISTPFEYVGDHWNSFVKYIEPRTYEECVTWMRNKSTKSIALVLGDMSKAPKYYGYDIIKVEKLTHTE